MKQIVFISGKGGTGKSTIVASLAKYVNNKVLADCDVDAPNLHILLENELVEKSEFEGAKEAFIDKSSCIECGKCIEVCRFDAITDDYVVKPMKCEGCNACVVVCPTNTISLNNVKIGGVYKSKTPYGMFAHALLDIGAEGSGKLVAEVKKKTKDYIKDKDYTLIDGSPGIGCVVIASITGADGVVIVSEATKSGKSDLERVLLVTKHFGIKAYVCINKYDLNKSVTKEITTFCEENNTKVIGKIPFEPKIVKALQQLKTPMDDVGLEDIKAEIINMWNILEKEITL